MEHRPRAERPLRVVPFLVTVLVTTIACAQKLSVGVDDGSDDDAGSSTPSFTPPSDGGDADVEPTPTETLNTCIGTECVWPRATCDDGSIARCNIDLLTDNDNCGECGNKCGSYKPLSMGTQCTEGKCRPFCTDSARQDCNGRLEDGCESNVLRDRNNCGQCGNQCPEGLSCENGACACSYPEVVQNGACVCGYGTVLCDGYCTDVSIDNWNCGSCGIVCPYVDMPCDPKDLPPYTSYSCAGGQCGQFGCSDYRRKDCNGDLSLGCDSSDGCEVDISTDPENCGACGNKCAPGQYCRQYGGKYQCVCGPGETACGDLAGSGDISCVDVSSDTANCGACGHACPTLPNAKAVCQSGICGFECPPNKADCNGDWTDGCEVDLLSNMKNCGACGQACDVDGGQPCVNGSCLMVECDAGIPH